MFKQATGVYMVHIPYRGSAPAFTDLIAGQVQLMAESIPQAAQYAKQGNVRALAVTSRTRSTALPDTPTMIESAGTPRDVVAKLSAAFKQVLETPEIRDRMIAQGADPAFMDADAFGRFLAAELPRWATVVKASGAKVE